MSMGWFVFIVFLVLVVWVGGDLYERLKGHFVGITMPGNDGLMRGTAFVVHSKKTQSDDMRITIGNVPISDASASTHISFAGSTGTGKSNALKEVAATVVRRVDEAGDKVIAVDFRGELLSLFGGESDLILNQFDKRDVKWNPFSEVFDPRFDFEMLAHSFYPHKPTKSPEWDDYAENMLANIMRKLYESGETSPAKVIELVSKTDRKSLEEFLAGTSSAIESSGDATKMFTDVRGVLANGLKAWYTMSPDGTFSVRRWIREKDGGILWLPYMPQHKQALKHVVSGIVDLLIVETLSLPDSKGKRIWLLVDEATAIGKLPSILDGMAQGRKPGLVSIVCFQSYAQLRMTYGEDEAQALVSNCRTKLVLPQGSHLDAEFWANELGKREYVQEERSSSSNRGSSSSMTHPGSTNEGSSDSVNFRIKTDHVVLPSELIDMPDNTGYLRVAGSGGIARVRIPFLDLEPIADNYIPAPTHIKES